jgi:hypothetical protein
VTLLAPAVRTSTSFEATYTTGIILAPSAENIRANISYTGLRKSGDEVIADAVEKAHVLFQQIGSNPFVVAGDQSIVPKHRSPMGGEPSKDGDSLVVRGPLELEHRHVLFNSPVVDRANVVPVPFRSWVRKIGIETAIYARAVNLRQPNTQVAWCQTFVSSLDGQKGTINYGLETLLVETFARDLR